MWAGSGRGEDRCPRHQREQSGDRKASPPFQPVPPAAGRRGTSPCLADLVERPAELVESFFQMLSLRD